LASTLQAPQVIIFVCSVSLTIGRLWRGTDP
jgi:hypothetical protein